MMVKDFDGGQIHYWGRWKGWALVMDLPASKCYVLRHITTGTLIVRL
jgi:hypothetical protein